MSFILNLLTNKLALTAIGFVLVLAYGGYYHYQYKSTVERFDAFKVDIRAKGEAAQTLSDQQAANDKLAKEKADADHKAATNKLSADIKRLHDNPNRDSLSTTKAVTNRPDLTCFATADLNRALKHFVDGVTGLVIEGQQATVDLDNAKSWAH